jgi:hypothetical protein
MAKSLPFLGAFKVPPGRRDDPNIDVSGPGRTDRGDSFLLEHAQELRLYRPGELPHLI